MSKTRLTDACDGCPGRCCTRKFGFTSVRLTATEVRDPLFRPHLKLDEDNDAVMVLGKSACVFLDQKTRRCKIYEQRPMACRGFVCHSHSSRDVAQAIYNYPALKGHLKKLNLLPAPPQPRPYFWMASRSRKSKDNDAMWHLREHRGRRNQDIWRYSAKHGTYGVCGRFGDDGKFYRRTKDAPRPPKKTS